jgi:hypothetical protein
MASPKDKIDSFKDKFNKTLSRGSTYVDLDGNPVPYYETPEEEKKMTPEQETAALQKEMDEALPVDLSDPKFSREQNIGDPKKKDRSKNKLIMKPGQLGGKKKTKRKRKGRKGKKTKKKALKKRHLTKKLRKKRKKRSKSHRRRK